MNSERRPPSTLPRGGLRHAGLVLAAALGLSAMYSCSLLVEGRSQQCETTADCNAGLTCDPGTHLCVGMATGSSSSTGSSSTGSSSSSASSSGATGCDVDGGVAGGGCWNCEPTSNAELLNQCTDGMCFPFDNAARVKALADGGKLPSLDGGP